MILLEIFLVLCFIFFLYVNKVDTSFSLLGIYHVHKNPFYYLKYVGILIYLEIRSQLRKFKSENVLGPEVNEDYKNVTLHACTPSELSISINIKELKDSTTKYVTICLWPSKIIEDPLVTFIILDKDSKEQIIEENYIKFSGILKSQLNPIENYNVLIDIKWHGTRYPIFHYQNHLSRRNLARKIANEFWNKDYLNYFERFRPIFYEQFGKLEGSIIINDHVEDLHCDNSMKSIIYGDKYFKKSIHRYVMHYITLKNGDRINIGVAYIISLFPNLEFGFRRSLTDRENTKIDYCDLKLYKHGENGDPPYDYSFTFNQGKKSYRVAVQGKINQRVSIDQNRGQILIDNNCKFNVNGEIGSGTVEWYYRRILRNKEN